MDDITLYLSPGFNLTTTLLMTDGFAALNALDTAPRYRILFASKSGGPVASLQGPTLDTEDVDLIKSGSDIVIVSTSRDPEAAVGAPLARHLRYWNRQGRLIIGLESAAIALAGSGLLTAPACIAADHRAAFRAAFPREDLSNTLYDTEGSVRTCTGGAAALDMVLAILAERHAPDLVRAVRDRLVAPPLRDGNQAVTAGSQTPLGDGMPKPLLAAIEHMRAALDQSLSVPALASETQLSQRQLERLFRSHTGRSPNQYYRMLRLDRAREMVTRSARQMPDIARECGFASPVHFSRAYKEQFGLPPMRDRVRSRVG
ncbi:MAG: helix-turn-helix domain-containing protein [Pseudomonadota bacterium]